MSETHCPERGEDDPRPHCFHESTHEGQATTVCCWCGDYFVTEFLLHDEHQHGEYTPLKAEATRLAYLGRVWREQSGMAVADLDELAALAEKIGSDLLNRVRVSG